MGAAIAGQPLPRGLSKPRGEYHGVAQAPPLDHSTAAEMLQPFRTPRGLMLQRFHQALGFAVLLIYGYVVFHLSAFLPGIDLFSSGRAGALALALPPAAIVCFLFPEQLMWKFSPRTPPDYEYLLTEGVWYALGYALLLLGAGLLLLFRSAT